MRHLALVGAAVLAAALTGCSHPSQPTLAADKVRQAYEVGERLAAEDRADTQEHRAKMARLIDANISKTREFDRTISLYLYFHNRSARRIQSLEAGLEVHDATGKRIGMTEISVERPIAAHGSVEFWYPLRYVRFGEDTGTMVAAAGRPKTARMDVTEIKYADGTDAGYDD